MDHPLVECRSCCVKGLGKGTVILSLLLCSSEVCGTHGLLMGRVPAGAMACASGAKREVAELHRDWSSVSSLCGVRVQEDWVMEDTVQGQFVERRVWNLSVLDEYRPTHLLRIKLLVLMKEPPDPQGGSSWAQVQLYVNGLDGSGSKVCSLCMELSCKVT